MSILIKKYQLLQTTFKTSFKKVYGCGYFNVKKLQHLLGLHQSTKINALPIVYKKKIKDFFEITTNKTYLKDYFLEKKLAIRRLVLLKNYKGIRHILKLPVHGQRTRSNHKTVRRLNFALHRINKYVKKKNIIKHRKTRDEKTKLRKEKNTILTKQSVVLKNQEKNEIERKRTRKQEEKFHKKHATDDDIKKHKPIKFKFRRLKKKKNS